MRISDWSSDVCSSDLPTVTQWVLPPTDGRPEFRPADFVESRDTLYSLSMEGKGSAGPLVADRKSVVEGKSVSVRVDLGGRRIIKQKHADEIVGNTSTYYAHSVIKSASRQVCYT